ncbi:MAG TPA: hypothetical protein VH969_23420 [Actinophytocola sp.]|jgi:hypothetical protein|uniref:hypothetical protein n=1 Tax=Actinophytocola sp. TaxID=1872138 RepID=UPI002F926455
MSEREEAYRAGKEARTEFVQRATRASRSSADSVTRLVNAAVYRYELEKRDEVDETEDPGTAESTRDTG